ncbi:MAG: FGGY-family carbohydrate kinase [Caldilinea sp.]
MPERFLVGIDIGTYSSKGVLIDENGRLIASHVEPHGIDLPRPGWVEQDADAVWWRDFVVICRRLLAQSDVRASDIAAVGVSSTSPCLLPVGEDGGPLRPGILYGIDTRATREIGELETIFGRQALFDRYGVTLSSQHIAPKIRWLQNHEPHVWARTRLLLSGTGYVVYRLTGAATIDIYDANTYAPLFDNHTLAWDQAVAEQIAPLTWLPRITWTCEIAGAVHAEAAAITGLAEGTPVITGTADAAAEAISAGLAQVGDLMVMYGSSIFFILKHTHFVRSRHFWVGPFLEPGAYAVTGGMSTAGSLTRWFRDHFAPEEVAAEKAGGANAYAALAALAASSPAGANGLVALPYFAGERTPLHDPDARGLFIGLTLSHTRADVYRALLESVGYGIRHNIDMMDEEDIRPQRILAVGGGVQNLTWMQMVSDIAGIEQHIPDQQIGASYGDALLAGVGVGVFPNVAAAAGLISHSIIIRPDCTMTERYRPFYELYRELYAQTAPIMHRLSVLARSQSDQRPV